MKRVELEDNIQGIDYVYTLHGAVKGINHAESAKDPGHDGNDIFGMTFQYYDNDYLGAGYQTGDVTSSLHPNQYGGMLKAAAWHSPANLNGPSAYGFTYDEKYQLRKADFGAIETGTSHAFTVDPDDAYQEGVSRYDKNGNIRNLLRTKQQGIVSEDYTYDYELNTNRLDKIRQDGTDVLDYTYNAIGQLEQQAGGGKTFKVHYNAYGLIEEVLNGSDELLQTFHYDDRGHLLKKGLYNSGVLAKETYYVSDASGNVLAIYEKPASGILSLAEVPIYGAGRLGTYKPGETTYFYEINDHLGNVRAVIGKPETEDPGHSFETASDAGFGNFHRVVNDLYDHTDDGKTYQYVHQLHGGNNRQIGMTRSYEVSPGDVIRAEVYVKYEGTEGNGGNLANFASILLGAFGLPAPLPGETGTLSKALESYGEMIAAGNPLDNDSHPKGFITILVFNKEFKLVDAAWDQLDAAYVQTSGKKKPHDFLLQEVTIAEPGYAFIYLSNEGVNEQNIYFDDIHVTFTQSPIVAGADYYPYGLAMENREITREDYRYGYQGQYSEESKELGTNEFELRFYDAKMARWLSADPYGQYHSPYLAMGNTPHMSVDPDGGWNWYTAGIGFVAGAGIGYATTGDWEGALIGGLAGGALGGVMFDYSSTKTGFSSQVGKHVSPRGFPYAVPSKFARSLTNINFGRGTYSVLASTVVDVAVKSYNEEGFPNFEGTIPYVPGGEPSASVYGIDGQLAGDVPDNKVAQALWKQQGEIIAEELVYGYEQDLTLAPSDNSITITMNANSIHLQNAKTAIREVRNGKVTYKGAVVDLQVKYKKVKGRKALKSLAERLRGFKYQVKVKRLRN